MKQYEIEFFVNGRYEVAFYKAESEDEAMSMFEEDFDWPGVSEALICGEKEVEEDCDEDSPDEYDESMDGDFDSGMASAGYGTDEDYGGCDERY